MALPPMRTSTPTMASLTLEKRFTSRQYTFSYAGENVTIALENGVIKTAFGDFRYIYEQLLSLLK